MDPTLYSSYAGTYQMGDFSMNIAREDGRLVAQIRNQKFPLVPESPRDYVFRDTDTHIIFETDDNGQIRELILRENGTDAYLNRTK